MVQLVMSHLKNIIVLFLFYILNHGDAYSMESTSHVDPTPIDSRMAMKEGQRIYLSHDLLSKIASGLGLMDFLSFRCIWKDWHIASSEVFHEDKSLD